MRVSDAHRQPRRIVAKTLLLSGSTLLAASLLAGTPGAASGWNQGSAEATLWSLLNGARVNNGMAPLQQHGTLVSLARWRSKDMIQRDYFSHTILGTGCEVYCYYDSNGLSYVWGGENIGWNSGRTDAESPIRVHNQFMNSAGHRANVLNAAFQYGGVGAWAADNVTFQGYVQDPRMYTELFMQVASAPPPPSGGGGGTVPPPPGSGGSVAAPAAPAPPPQPKPREVAVDAPQRPVSGTGLDGVSVVVAALPEVDVAARLAADDALGVPRSAASVAGADAEATTDTPDEAGPMRVEAAPAPEPGFFEALFGTLFGFLLG